ncbi:Uncharacterised protein [Yersinia frederiksenii]|nr:Uncharacterised protein [Yersinia frederiksenii]
MIANIARQPVVPSQAVNLMSSYGVAVAFENKNRVIATNEKTNHTPFLTVNLKGWNMEMKWLTESAINPEFDILVIQRSIDSPTTQRPDWVKTGADFVKWMRIRKEERLNGHSS